MVRPRMPTLDLACHNHSSNGESVPCGQLCAFVRVCGRILLWAISSNDGTFT